MKSHFTVEVCYALADGATVIEVEIVAGTSVQAAIDQSGLRERCPQLSLSECGLGSFGSVMKPEDVVKPGDRIEIYRPLLNDPKELRRRAARKQQA